ncbi:MAG: proline--tRNA ligase [Planctomycetes bacterium]|nr:proline--tRNA ligase [Planctomycetota bacterium]
MAKEAITPRAEDPARWYTDVVLGAELADYSPVKGCMVIRPHGYALWELLRDELDRRIRATGHRNAYFPLFIPQSFLAREAEHVEGFAKECAIVTHTRLRAVKDGDGVRVEPDPESRLEEPLVVRPTSETIMYSMFAKWIQSYRDLPLLLNQWANIVRWEMRTRLFLRTTEFLWQEGHTAHATSQEAEEEVRRMLGVYREVAEEVMALPVLVGRKTEAQKFAGALHTYCLETMTLDRKALQAGTSHHLGQNFARAFGVKFQDAAGQEQLVWQTSWGVSTRLVGALVMGHSDDDGLVLPPRLAPVQVAVVPIWKGDAERTRICEAAHAAGRELREAGLRVEVDDRDALRPGFKYHEWELKGVPVRLELGPRDLEKGQVVAVRRDDARKLPIPRPALARGVRELLDDIQGALYRRALAFRQDHTRSIDGWDEFAAFHDDPGGFARSPFCGGRACEEAIQEATRATVRVIEFDRPEEPGRCVRCGGAAEGRVVFARAY